MKLGTLFAFAANAVTAWDQPTYREVMNLWRTRSDAAWGAPVGLRNARHWSDCPAIDANAIPGAAGLRCNQATCALVCQPGHVSKGRRRVRCRKNKRKNVWFWKNTLGSCKTCDVETPTSNDPLMTTTCKVNEGTNRRFCKLSCPADHTAAGSKERFVKIACKCPRGSGECGWYNRKRKANYENYTCTPKPTPAPVVEPSGDGSGDSGSGDGSGNGWPTGLTENENGNTFIPGK